MNENRPFLADVDTAIDDLLNEKNCWITKKFSVDEKKDIFLKAVSKADLANMPRLEAIERVMKQLYGDGGRILDEEEYRICDMCGKPMTDGYVYYGRHLCEDCRHEKFSNEEWTEEYEKAGGDDDNDAVYWTDWLNG